MSQSSPVDTDRNLLFGVLALQADLLDNDQFAEACSAWAARKETPLADLLVERGWLTAEDRGHVEYLLERKLRKHGGDAHASLAAVASPAVRRALDTVSDRDIERSLASLPAVDGPASDLPTVDALPAAGRYRVLRPHAKGGLGEVFVAEDTELHRPVALKQMQQRHADDPSSRARFLLEAEITGGLEHPGIVPVYGLNAYPDGRPFYAMRLIQGDCLQEALRRFHQAPDFRGAAFRQLLHRFVDACNAVAYAHSRGVLHRDLKPANVMLGPFGETLVVDWGLAKVVGCERSAGTMAEATLQPASAGSQAETVAGTALGTPAYMSPEQAAGQLDDLGPTSDVYSLGATLHAVLTGRAPFEGPDPGEVLRRVRSSDFSPPRQVQPAVPPALDAICRKAMMLSPAARYPTPLALAADVERWLADEPVAAYVEPWSQRTRRWMGRHRSLVAAGVAALAVAVVGLLLSTALLGNANRREREAREQAVRQEQEAAHQRDLALANFQMARDAVEEYGTKVSDDPRLKEKDLEALRKELLQSAVKFHQKFVEQYGDDPSLRADLGRAYLDLGKLIGNIDDATRAIALNRRAIALYEQLIVEHPDDSSSPVQLALALIQLGQRLDDRAQTKESREAYERALQTLEAARRQHGASRLLTRQYVRACNNLAYLLYNKVGAQRETLAAYRRGVAFLDQEKLAETPDLADVVAQAELYTQLGATLGYVGRGQEGLVWCEKSLALLQTRLTPTNRPAELLASLSLTYDNIGRIQSRQAQPEKALEAHRKAVAIDEELVRAHPSDSRHLRGLGTDLNTLALVLLRSGRREEGQAAMKKSLEAKEQLVVRYPGLPDYEANLARGLFNQAEHTANQEQAQEDVHRGMKLARELTSQHPEVAQYQTALARGHNVQALLHARARQWEAALASQTEAVHVVEQLLKRSDLQEHRNVLGHDLSTLAEMGLQAGKPEVAFSAYRGMIGLSPSDPTAHYRLGTALMNHGRLDDAIISLNQAVALKPDYAEAQCNLGHCLNRKGRFAEGRAALQRGHQLGSRLPGWRYPSAQWVSEADRLIQLDGRLPAILQGQALPADGDEELALAVLCQRYKRLYTAATRFYARAFTGSPQLAEDHKAAHRYNAARAAAQAGCGQGADAGQLDEQERSRLRRQALDWLRADLDVWAKQAAADTEADRAPVRQTLGRWQRDPALAGLRDAPELAKLPADEQEACRKLWADVEALLKKAAGEGSR
jgi:serine/threonine-protein kinase